MGLLTDVLTSGASKAMKTGMDWAQGTKAYKDIQGVRQSKINPWYSAKKQPGSKNEGDTSSSTMGTSV